MVHFRYLNRNSGIDVVSTMWWRALELMGENDSTLLLLGYREAKFVSLR